MPKKSQCRYVCQKAFRFPESHSLCRLRFRGLFLHSASEQPRERAALHLLTTPALAPQAFPPCHTCKTQRRKAALHVDTCTEVERSCMFAVNSGVKEKEFPYLCRLDASEPDPKLYILQLCVSASSCFLFSPLPPLTSFWPFLSFALSLSPSLNTCVQLVAVPDSGYEMSCGQVSLKGSGGGCLSIRCLSISN
ncbi:hypothetical protein Q8A67_020390 [Cirrhinus molitorella]|uniref:Uncharacterized protein n=1 Tax=Cirrhinus molitorella TaxID=172907 RepID=A0AA88P576_9TELE|nr:hypothetical protein Q8A67_020390 [Cirrhinus molitorella]